MRPRQVPAGNALSSRPVFVALLLAAWCTSSIAATGVDVECPETERNSALATLDITLPALAIPSLTIDAADHGVDSSAAIKEEIVDRPLASPAISAADEEDVTEVDETETANTEAAPAATRLPGVSESDQPRFRRQMYRTDI